MSVRKLMAIECAVLLALGWALLGTTGSCPGESAAPPPGGPTLLGSPSFANQTLKHTTEVDEGANGSIDDFSTGQITTDAMPGNQLLLSSASVFSSVALSIGVDADTFSVDCVHNHDAFPINTRCRGSLRASFPIEEIREDAIFDVAIVDFTPFSAEISSSIFAPVSIECGLSAVGVDLDTETGALQARVAVPVAAGGTVCNVHVDIEFLPREMEMTTIGGPTNTGVLQSIRVTALNIDPIECQDNAQCPSLTPFCDPITDTCGEGDTKDGCITAANSCDGEHPHCVDLGFGAGCSGGWQAPCYFDGQCAAGHACVSNWCVGVVGCNNNGDCPLGEHCLSGGSCAPVSEGCPGCGCFDGRSCIPADSSGFGICQFNECQVIVFEGERCDGPGELCEFGTVCLEQSTGTCELPLGLGESCATNDECDGFFTGQNSCIGDLCAPRSGSGGGCEEQIDCQNLFFCDTMTNTCN